ncbi:MAG: sigma-70 family RNA polymerase sigma factor [Nocardiaceae bacterium]|nr:sigma-70 family RNA polymerase sigma factor [Nocardiaceae bacterium]
METSAERFTEMYVRDYPRVLAFALRRTDATTARDATDEAFLQAWRRFDELPKNPLPWLLVTTRNTLSDEWRRQDRQRCLAEELAKLERSVTVSSAAEAAALERISVLRALARLPDQDRESLMLTVWDGLSYGAAAAVAGCRPSAFAVRVHRARRRLAKELTKEDLQSLRRQTTALDPSSSTVRVLKDDPR